MTLLDHKDKGQLTTIKTQIVVDFEIVDGAVVNQKEESVE